MENMVSFWKGKRVFITGHTGFKGSWLSLWLQHLQANVIGFSLSPPTPVNFFVAANVGEKMIDIRGDIRNYQELSHAIFKHQPEIIFHLAAQSLVRHSYSHPIETYATNVMGTVHLLEAARHCEALRAIINVTSDKCYENKEWHWGYREYESLGGFDPYSNSKGCSELVTNAYRNSFFNHQFLSRHHVGLASARSGNVIGGGDWAQDRLIPDLINSYVNNIPIQIRYPNAIRPWLHVLESLSGYLHLAERLYLEPQKYSEAWNFGPDEADVKSVRWITEETLKLLGKEIDSYKTQGNTREHEATYLKLDCSKAHMKLNWAPQWNISQALYATILWYKKYYMGADMKSLSLEQISNYATPKISYNMNTKRNVKID